MIITGAELDISPAYGWQGGPEFNTLIKQLRSGHERRRPLWDVAKHHYVLPFQNITNGAYLQHLKSAFLAARGSAYAFLAKDFSDYRAEGVVFGFGDGVETEFDLLMQYQFGSAFYVRHILHPVDPVFMVDGSPVAASFNATTRKVEFDVAPAESAALSWSGEHRVPVRFASDSFPMTIDNRTAAGYAMNGSVELREVWE